MKHNFQSLKWVEADRLKATISRINGGDCSKAEDFEIVFSVSGGSPSERLSYQARLTPVGTATISHVDALNAVRDQFTGGLPQSDFVALAQTIDLDALAASSPNEREQFIPDSLIGFVEMRLGDSSVRIYFPLNDEDTNQGERIRFTNAGQEVVLFFQPESVPEFFRSTLRSIVAILNKLNLGRT